MNADIILSEEDIVIRAIPEGVIPVYRVDVKGELLDTNGWSPIYPRLGVERIFPKLFEMPTMLNDEECIKEFARSNYQFGAGLICYCCKSHCTYVGFYRTMMDPFASERARIVSRNW